MLPMLWEAFQMENLVASCLGENQLAINRAQGGKPMPCTQPFSIQITPSTTRLELKPNARFSSAETINALTMNVRAFARSARKPLANFEMPYSTPLRVKKMPKADRKSVAVV